MSYGAQGDGSDAFHTWTVDGDGLISARRGSARIGVGNLGRGNMKIAASDCNGDGRDDLGFMHGYANGTIRTGASWAFSRVGPIERYPA